MKAYLRETEHWMDDEKATARRGLVDVLAKVYAVRTADACEREVRLLISEGDLVGALASALEAVRSHDRAGVGDVRATTPHAHVGWILNEFGRHAEALPHVREVVRIGRVSGLEKTRWYANAIQNLRFTTLELGQIDDALEHGRWLVEVRAAVFGPEGLEVAEANVWMAHVLERQGRHDESLGFSREALRIYTVSGHADTAGAARAHREAWFALDELRRFDDALRHAEAAHRIRLALGGEVWDTARAQLDLGYAFSRLGRHVEAQFQATAAVSACRARYGSRASQTASSLGWLAQFMSQAGEVADAAICSALAVAAMEIEGTSAADVLSSPHRTLASAVARLPQSERRATPARMSTLQIGRAVGDEVLGAAAAAQVLARLGRHDDAATWHQVAINHAQREFGEKDPRALRVRRAYAVTLAKLERVDEAIDTLDDILEVASSIPGLTEFQLVMGPVSTARAYRAGGQVKLAQKACEEIEDLVYDAAGVDVLGAADAGEVGLGMAADIF